jgi:hypothetical protein
MPTQKDREPFSRDELERLEGEVLPQRAATSIVDPHIATRLVGGLAAAAPHGAPPDPANADAVDASTEEP